MSKNVSAVACRKYTVLHQRYGFIDVKIAKAFKLNFQIRPKVSLGKKSTHQATILQLCASEEKNK
jgi:hypothetical protein